MSNTSQFLFDRKFKGGYEVFCNDGDVCIGSEFIEELNDFLSSSVANVDCQTFINFCKKYYQGQANSLGYKEYFETIIHKPNEEIPPYELTDIYLIENNKLYIIKHKPTKENFERQFLSDYPVGYSSTIKTLQNIDDLDIILYDDYLNKLNDIIPFPEKCIDNFKKVQDCFDINCKEYLYNYDIILKQKTSKINLTAMEIFDACKYYYNKDKEKEWQFNNIVMCLYVNFVIDVDYRVDVLLHNYNLCNFDKTTNNNDSAYLIKTMYQNKDILKIQAKNININYN